jgi:hypothetical protein
MEPKPISMTAPPCSSITKDLALPPPPSSKEIPKPMTLKDAGVDEVLGKNVNSNEKVTQYTTTVSSSLNTLEKVSAPLVNTRCVDHMEYEGKYFSKSKIKEIRIRKFNPNIFWGKKSTGRASRSDAMTLILKGRIR